MPAITINGKARDELNNLMTDMVLNSVEDRVANRRVKNVVRSAFARAYGKSLPTKGKAFELVGLYTGQLKREMSNKASYRVSSSTRRYRGGVKVTLDVDVNLPESGQVLGDGKNVTSGEKRGLVSKMITWFKFKGNESPVSAACATVNGWISRGRQEPAAPKWYDPAVNKKLQTNLRVELLRSIKRSMSYNKRL